MQTYEIEIPYWVMWVEFFVAAAIVVIVFGVVVGLVRKDVHRNDKR